MSLARAALVLLLVPLLCCASSSWKITRDADTAQAYRAFLRDNPHDENAETAQLLLSEKEFEAATKQHTLLAYKRYLDEFPNAPKAPAARALLEGMRFNAAKTQNTAQSWRLFLRDHPDGAHRDEAERAVAEAEFKEAGPAADAAALSKLAKEHPADPRRAELEARLDDHAFEGASKAGAFALYDYLRGFPAGVHRQAVQAQLLSLRVKALIVSGRVGDAKAALDQSPLGAALKEAKASVAQAEADQKHLESRDPLVRAARAEHYLRSISDLVKSLSAPDPLDRWQAAEELGHHVSTLPLDALIDAFRTARNPLIRQHAFDALRAILKALPPEVAEYEVATRLEALRDRAGSAEAFIVVAGLWDAAGMLELAASDYQRAWDKNLPDPVILRRWVEIRRERRQLYSSAVAARQLSLWAESVAKDAHTPGRGERIAISDVRELCAAAKNAAFALAAIEAAKSGTRDFPEDLAQYELQAISAVRLTSARLKDAELLLRTQDAHARTCEDDRVKERLSSSVKERLQALRVLARKGGPAATVVIASAQRTDPSFEVRQVAASLAHAQLDLP